MLTFAAPALAAVVSSERGGRSNGNVVPDDCMAMSKNASLQENENVGVRGTEQERNRNDMGADLLPVTPTPQKTNPPMSIAP